MKNIILYLLLLLSPAAVIAQDTNTETNFSSVDDAAVVAKQIMEASGEKMNFYLAEGNVPNAAAVMYAGKRFIFYNPKFMERLNKTTGTKWAAISVLAHEMGHHLHGSDGRMATELEADEFSGFVLEKMGATLEEAQAAMALVPATVGSYTHPAGNIRIASIEKGWKTAGGKEAIVAAKSSVNKTDDATNKIADVYFKASPDAVYFISKDKKIIRTEDGITETIGQLIAYTDDDFPYIMKDESGYKLYVHRTGTIYSAAGKTVGYIKAV